MNKILAYFIGGSHDLTKMVLNADMHHIERPQLMGDEPHYVGYDHNGQPDKVICKVERYQRTHRLRGQRNAFVYECINE